MARKTGKKKKRILRKIIILLLIVVFLFLVMCFVTKGAEGNGITAEAGIENLELPEPIDGEQIIRHTGYTLSYNEEAEQPSYVAYELTRAEVLNQNVERDDDFRADPMVRTGSAELNDYRGSGYDRGHMAPAADFRWSAEAMSDTFYLSNMSPQDPSFNRGIWADLEAAVRVMAYENESIYVVTGPVLTDGPYETIGENEVAIPKEYYKVILDYTEPDIKAIGFLLPNEGSSKSLESFTTTVNEVEERTGIDFYPALPDEQEELIEGTLDLSRWSFRTSLPESAYDEDVEEITYVSDPKDRIIEEIYSIFNEIKSLVFEYTGTEEIARKIGLL